ncbi:hypothetical protein FXF50_17805 [Micromonospora sp. AP08]|nr:hypothetical protein FXF50_17805 [Micromonospora sp. AP08]
MPADRDRLDPMRDNDQGPWGPCPPLRVGSFVSRSILLCAADQTATRHPSGAAENAVAGRMALSATPPTRNDLIEGAAGTDRYRRVTDRGSRRDLPCRTFCGAAACGLDLSGTEPGRSTRPVGQRAC